MMMTSGSIYCQIWVKGHLSMQWSDWFSGLVIDNQAQGEAILSGTLADHAALYGVLDRLRDLGVELLALNCRTDLEGSRVWASR
jgi:hypothetical protein